MTPIAPTLSLDAGPFSALPWPVTSGGTSRTMPVDRNLRRENAQDYFVGTKRRVYMQSVFSLSYPAKHPINVPWLRLRAPIVRFNAFEILATPIFFFASDFNSRTSDKVQTRRTTFFFF